MIQFAPVDLFREQPEFAKQWRDEARQKMFHEAATHCLAKMALDGATADHLTGAKTFLKLFLNCAEPVEAISVASPARLDYNVEEKVAARNAKKE